MGSPNPSTFLGNFQCEVVNQLKNNDFYSIFHNETVTANLFEILEMLAGIYLACAIEGFLSIWI